MNTSSDNFFSARNSRNNNMHVRANSTHGFPTEFRMTQRARYQGMGVQISKYKWQPYSILSNKFDVRMKERAIERDEMNRSLSPGIWHRQTQR